MPEGLSGYVPEEVSESWGGNDELGQVNEGELAPGQENEQSGMRYEGAIATEKKEGQEQNGDASLLNPELGLAGVFDGRGSAAAEVANFINEYIDAKGLSDDKQEIRRELKNLVLAVETMVKQGKKEERIDNQDSTTLSLAKICQDEEAGKSFLAYFTVGNSPIFVFRQDKLIKISDEDDAFKSQPEREYIRDIVAEVKTWHDYNALKRSEQEAFGNRVLSTAELGGEIGWKDAGLESKWVDFYDLQAGDQVFLFTDGVTNNLSIAEITEMIKQGGSQEEITKRLTEKANQESKKRGSQNVRATADDVSVVMLAESGVRKSEQNESGIEEAEKAEKEALEAEIAALEAEKSRLGIEKEQLEAEIAALREEKEQLEAELAAGQAAVEGGQAANAQEKITQEELGGMIAQLNSREELWDLYDELFRQGVKIESSNGDYTQEELEIASLVALDGGSLAYVTSKGGMREAIKDLRDRLGVGENGKRNDELIKRQISEARNKKELYDVLREAGKENYRLTISTGEQVGAGRLLEQLLRSNKFGRDVVSNDYGLKEAVYRLSSTNAEYTRID